MSTNDNDSHVFTQLTELRHQLRATSDVPISVARALDRVVERGALECLCLMPYGPRGSGKSTMLNQVLYALWKHRPAEGDLLLHPKRFIFPTGECSSTTATDISVSHSDTYFIYITMIDDTMAMALFDSVFRHGDPSSRQNCKSKLTTDSRATFQSRLSGWRAIVENDDGELADKLEIPYNATPAAKVLRIAELVAWLNSDSSGPIPSGLVKLVRVGIPLVIRNVDIRDGAGTHAANPVHAFHSGRVIDKMNDEGAHAIVCVKREESEDISGIDIFQYQNIPVACVVVSGVPKSNSLLRDRITNKFEVNTPSTIVGPFCFSDDDGIKSIVHWIKENAPYAVKEHVIRRRRCRDQIVAVLRIEMIDIGSTGWTGDDANRRSVVSHAPFGDISKLCANNIIDRCFPSSAKEIEDRVSANPGALAPGKAGTGMPELPAAIVSEKDETHKNAARNALKMLAFGRMRFDVMNDCVRSELETLLPDVHFDKVGALDDMVSNIATHVLNTKRTALHMRAARMSTRDFVVVCRSVFDAEKKAKEAKMQKRRQHPYAAKVAVEKRDRREKRIFKKIMTTMLDRGKLNIANEVANGLNSYCDGYTDGADVGLHIGRRRVALMEISSIFGISFVQSNGASFPPELALVESVPRTIARVMQRYNLECKRYGHEIDFTEFMVGIIDINILPEDAPDVPEKKLYSRLRYFGKGLWMSGTTEMHTPSDVYEWAFATLRACSGWQQLHALVA